MPGGGRGRMETVPPPSSDPARATTSPPVLGRATARATRFRNPVLHRPSAGRRLTAAAASSAVSGIPCGPDPVHSAPRPAASPSRSAALAALVEGDPVLRQPRANAPEPIPSRPRQLPSPRSRSSIRRRAASTSRISRTDGSSLQAGNSVPRSGAPVAGERISTTGIGATPHGSPSGRGGRRAAPSPAPPRPRGCGARRARPAAEEGPTVGALSSAAASGRLAVSAMVPASALLVRPGAPGRHRPRLPGSRPASRAPAPSPTTPWEGVAFPASPHFGAVRLRSGTGAKGVGRGPQGDPAMDADPRRLRDGGGGGI